MLLAPGVRLGAYEVSALIGAGGMGQVYRAKDTKLGRQVALKILPDTFIHDPDRLARFRREAQVLASLNHPHIGAIYGLDEADGQQFLVLEFVDGETLHDRIARGPIPIDEALPIARQISEALEAAHEQGIIHRDLKPANIKVRRDGTVKVLDFGLAKAVDPIEGTDSSQSPTITSPAIMTGGGVILGTAAYMSPEQARGKAVDKRSDIWAFGCVLYEMLTGTRTFSGNEVSDTLAAVLRGEPDWAALPPSTPRTIRRLLRHCLEKDCHDRLQAIGDARIEIKEALTAGSDDVEAPAFPPKRRFVPVIGAMIVAGLAGGVGAWMLKPSAPVVQPSVTRALIAVQPFDQRTSATSGANNPPVPFRAFRTAVALSSDGRTLVFRSVRDTRGQLFVRPMDRLQATAIPGTEGANSPFFSPDGKWIGFWVNSELRKVPLTGGPASTIAGVPGTSTPVFGASWGDGDIIVFATSAGLWRVPAAGGRPEAVSKPSETEFGHYLPRILPGGKAVLYTLVKTMFRWDDAQIVVRSLVTGEQKVLIEDGADARYVATGHLVFVRRGVLMAAPFDVVRLELTGAPVALIDGVMQAANTVNTDTESGAAQFAVADRGTLVYVTGGIAPEQERELVWVDRNGTVKTVTALRRELLAPRLAPDGERVAVTTQPAGANMNARVWIYDVRRSTLMPLTTVDEDAYWSVWSPDGTRVAFSLAIGGKSNLFWKSSDGTGKSERLTTGDYGLDNYAPSAWSSDGTLAFVQEPVSAIGADIRVLDVASTDYRARPVAQTPADERFPSFSADGRWLAYTSTASGHVEVYVQPYPGPGPRVLVSTDGGSEPAWRSDGTELFYAVVAGSVVRMMVVPVKATTAGFSAGTPRKLFEGRYVTSSPVRGYDVTADGQRFLMVRPLDPPPEPAPELVVVENWLEELKARVPATR